MKTRIITPDDTAGMLAAAETLRYGGLVAFPTETVYGLGGNALDPAAAAKIYEAKGRPSDNPLIIHVNSIDEAALYCEVCDLYERLYRHFLPGPLTVILPKRDNIPSEVTAGLDTVAVRIPSHPVARKLISLSGIPVAAPSANSSGRPSPTTALHVAEDLIGRIDFIIDGGSCDFGLESTIVKPEGNNRLTVLRPGAVTPEMLSKVCDEVTLAPSVTGFFRGTTPEAPGMKYRHYAPNLPVVILDGSGKEIENFLSDKTNFGFLCFDEDMNIFQDRDDVVAISMGGCSDYAAQAHRLFDCLRHFDEVEGIDTIYARMPCRDGVSLAVFNRLVKAAGMNIRKL